MADQSPPPHQPPPPQKSLLYFNIRRNTESKSRFITSRNGEFVDIKIFFSRRNQSSTFSNPFTPKI